MVKEASSKPGKLEELLARTKAKDPGPENIWGLPEFSHGDEAVRLRNEMELILSERDQWKQLAEEEKKKRDRNEADRRSDQEEIRKLSKTLAETDNDRASLKSRVQELESRIENLPKTETTLHHLQKQIRELERETGLLAGAKDALNKNLASALEKVSALEKKKSEQADTLAFLKTALKNPTASESVPFQGEVILLITLEDPAPYFESAKVLGLTLLVHDGQSKNIALDRALANARRAILWGEEPDFHEGVLKALRSSGKPHLILPSLGPTGLRYLGTSPAK
jgi:predicted RNase H-like nuclease (RuvC/YqgF family)